MVSWVALGALVGDGGALHGRDSGMALTAMCSHGWMALLDLHLEGVASGGGAVHHIQSQATEMAPQKEITERGGDVEGPGEIFPFFCIVFPQVSNDIGVFFRGGYGAGETKPTRHMREQLLSFASNDLAQAWDLGNWDASEWGYITGCSQPLVAVKW